MAKVTPLSTIEAPPPPWRLLQAWAVGGLFQVGFAEDSDLLLVLSSQGRGLFDCTTGHRLARDANQAHDFFDPVKLSASGFGSLAGKTVRMAGLFGGGLPLTTQDGWFLEAQALHDRTATVFLTPPSSPLPAEAKHPRSIAVGDEGSCELRAYGFSETGQSFIIATSCMLTLFSRSAILPSSLQ